MRSHPDIIYSTSYQTNPNARPQIILWEHYQRRDNFLPVHPETSECPSPSFSSARERREKLVNGNVDTISAPSDLLTTKLGGAPPLTAFSFKVAQSITGRGSFMTSRGLSRHNGWTRVSHFITYSPHVRWLTTHQVGPC